MRRNAKGKILACILLHTSYVFVRLLLLSPLSHVTEGTREVFQGCCLAFRASHADAICLSAIVISARYARTWHLVRLYHRVSFFSSARPVDSDF